MKLPTARSITALLFLVDRAYLFELSLRGVQVGKDVEVIGRPNIYHHGGQIILGDGVRLWSRDRNYIAHNRPVRLFTGTKRARIEIGARTRLNGVSIAATERIIVGEDCYLAAGTTLIDTNGHSHRPDERRTGQRDEPAPVTIGNRVWTGLNVIVLKGVSIGDDTVVGAGSIVTRDLPARTMCAGNPARVVRHM